jgi:hypothetical protein
MTENTDELTMSPEGLLVWRPVGELNLPKLEDILSWMEDREKEAPTCHRLGDLSQVDRLNLSYAEISQIAERRRTVNYIEGEVKSAIFAPTPLVYGYARMYQQLLDCDKILLEVFEALPAAKEWLETEEPSPEA